MFKSAQSSKKSKKTPPDHQNKEPSRAVISSLGQADRSTSGEWRHWSKFIAALVVSMFIFSTLIPLLVLSRVDTKAVTAMYQTSVDACVKARIEVPYSSAKDNKGAPIKVDATYVSEAQESCGSNVLRQIIRAAALGMFAIGAFLLTSTKPLFETFRVRPQRKGNMEIVAVLEKMELIGIACTIGLFMVGIYAFYSMITDSPADGAAWVIMSSGSLFAGYGTAILIGFLCAAFPGGGNKK